jgi:alpha-ketoglutarate-dependent taurine dioxygenase
MGMKAIDVLQHVDFKNMSEAEKKALEKKVLEHRKHLLKSIKPVDDALANSRSMGMKAGGVLQHVDFENMPEVQKKC